MSQENVEAMRGVRYRVTLPRGNASQRRSLTSGCSFASPPSTT
jgi:hypothetical protein